MSANAIPVLPEIPPNHGIIHELNNDGDSRIMWNHNNPDEVAAARSHFDALRAKHYIGYRAVGEKGERGDIINTFDPTAERIIMVPRQVGG
jgi:hypothetical protein